VYCDYLYNVVSTDVGSKDSNKVSNMSSIILPESAKAYLVLIGSLKL